RSTPALARLKPSEGILHLVSRSGHLVHIGQALGPVGGFTHLLHGRQEQAHQDGDDGHYHQQLNQGERPPASEEAKNGHNEILLKKEEERKRNLTVDAGWTSP